MPSNIRNETKSYIAKSGMTLTEIVSEYSKTNGDTSVQSLSNKLARGTIRYSECIEIARIAGYEIVWEPIIMKSSNEK